MPKTIGPKRPRKIFLAEHRLKRGLTQKQLAERVPCDEQHIAKWEQGRVMISTDALAALAEALGGDLMEPEDLYHHPDRPSPNQLLRELPGPDREAVLKTIRGLIKEAS